MLPTRDRSVAALLSDVQRALHLTQDKLGELMGRSRRTIIRYYQRGGIILPDTWEQLARAVHPHDRALAAELAAAAGQTLVSLGLEVPPAPPGPAAAPPAPARSRRREPTTKHLVDSVLCSAAEAMNASPQAVRPAVAAAVERMIALEMSPEEVLAALAAAASGERTTDS